MSRDLPPWRSAFYVLWACIHNMIAARPIGLAFADHDPRPVTRAELVRLAGPTRERPVAPQILFALTERR
jgi:hypothetical protein